MTQQQTNWLGRNWKWFVPTICFAAAFILVGVFFATLVFGATKIMKTSDAYRTAVAAAKADHRVVAVAGFANNRGQVCFRQYLRKQRPAGDQFVACGFCDSDLRPEGKGDNIRGGGGGGGKWSFSRLVVEVEGTPEKIDLNEQRKKGERTQIWRWEQKGNSSRSSKPNYAGWALACS